ncbi:ATP-dependent zinc metalloprotease FtsH [Clostridiaceae bacterium NSJ-31]|uniref:ATP-dependent zinc metalloprotease FtsH n=3 Tax=Ligaoa zhengdingensis TaxID=2763658 RepID=A0A926DYM0_9FIRM|nr:ATP-dependent zinc metalloprotease FtsH [Ligaoa zhengdingensis]
MVAEYNEAHPDSPITFDYIRAKDVSPLVQWMPTLILIGVMVLFWFLMMRQAGGGAGKAMSFAKMKVKSDDGRKTTFADVAGADEEKEELKEVVEFLKDPRRFNELGARIPKGVLLVGPPGTGKTLLARAVAGEAGVPFFSISGSDFVEMFVGVGASRVRDLFEQAKKNAPAIVFIDEIDAVGRQRGAGLGGGHDEREQTLNQLLVEMDGFGANSGVIVIAATNRADILDKALLRPGRFDRQIYVGYPDVEGREAILKVHTRGKPLGPDVNLRTIAQTTVGFTGADLENLANEAALLAARRGKKAITMQEIEEATIKVIAGPEKKSRKVSEKDKKLTAYHEAGHAIAHYSLPGQDPVHQVSIIPRGMAGGYTMSLPVEDESYRSKKWMQENIVTLLGGRVAEKLVLDDISTGASNDIQRATKMARDMVTRYGFSEKLGPIVYGTDDNEVFLGRDFGQARNYSENVAAEIDSEVREIIDNAYEQCKDILTEHMAELHKVAKYLYRYEKIDGDVFRRLMEDPNFPDEAHEQEMEEREERERRIEERAKKNTEEILAKKVEPNVPQDDEDKE